MSQSLQALLALAVLLVGVGLLIWARWSSGKATQKRIEAEAAKDALKQRERIDNALEASRAGGGDWNERLRAHIAKRK